MVSLTLCKTGTWSAVRSVDAATDHFWMLCGHIGAYLTGYSAVWTWHGLVRKVKGFGRALLPQTQ